MHGLIFRTVEAFVSDSFGADLWVEVLAQAESEVASFEAMLRYDDALFPRILTACGQVLDRDVSTVLEDIGTYLITHQRHAFVRRLMRFGGHTYVELLHSMDELPGRTRLAVTGLDLPTMTVQEHQPNHFTIQCSGVQVGFGHVLVGVLRAMADDYGTLAVLNHLGVKDRQEIIEVTVVEAFFAQDRGFSLAGPMERVAS
jgi:hypothetical protein